MGDDVEQAEKLRDPSHVRNYTEAEWRGFVADAGLGIDEVRFFEQAMDCSPGSRGRGARARRPSASASCSATASRRRRLTLAKIAIRAAQGR